MQRRTLIAGALAGGAPHLVRAAPRTVVLELFTSQGCSSCPPADALLGRLAQRSDVIALAWHVDYWDRLGWRDPFATRGATERQRAYARQLGSEVFTPALVVNGATVVVGSARSSVAAAIEAARALTVPVTIETTDGGTTVQVAAPQGPVRALRIVYDAERTTDIGAGENEARRLREYRIVREVETLAEWEGAARRFTVRPPGTGRGQAILVQSANLRVLGAADQPPG